MCKKHTLKVALPNDLAELWQKIPPGKLPSSSRSPVGTPCLGMTKQNFIDLRNPITYIQTVTSKLPLHVLRMNYLNYTGLFASTLTTQPKSWLDGLNKYLPFLDHCNSLFLVGIKTSLLQMFYFIRRENTVRLYGYITNVRVLINRSNVARSELCLVKWMSGIIWKREATEAPCPDPSDYRLAWRLKERNR